MKKNRILLAATAAFIMVSCNQELQPEGPQPSEEKLIHVSFEAGFTTTKTYINDEYSVIWQSSDHIAVYDGTAIRDFSVTSCNGSSAVFEGDIAEGTETVSAAYPYSGAALVEGILTPQIPSTQIITSQGTAQNVIAAVAAETTVESGAFRFENACAYLEIEVSSTNPVSSLLVKGNAGEAIAGTSTYAVLKAEEGNLPEGKCFLVLNPGTYENGLQIVASSNDKKYVLKTSSAAVFPVSGGLSTGDIVANPAATALTDVIMTEAELRAWAENASIYADGDKVTLGADIALEDGEWIPANLFLGIFDGGDHKISNIVMENASINSGFISVLGNSSSETSACVKNLILGSADGTTYDGTSISKLSTTDNSAYRYAAGAVGYAHVGSLIDNVTNFIPVEVTSECTTRHRCGGVAGTAKANVTIRHCKNYGSVTDNQAEQSGTVSRLCTAGGICGAVDGKDSFIWDCQNYGNITNNSPYVNHTAGIVGYIYYDATVKECSNAGNITHAVTSIGDASGYAVRIGGITAATLGSVTSAVIEKCSNSGVINQTAANGSGTDSKGATINYSTGMGGIIGVIAKTTTIKGCSNSGTVRPTTVPTVNGLCQGGIAGYVTGSTTVLTITKADDGTLNTNSGTLKQVVDYTSSSYMGGILGYHNGSTTEGVVEYCENTGEVTTAPQSSKVTISMGGICGASKCKVLHCTNKGTIYSHGAANNHTAYNAGIVGGSSAPPEVAFCINEGLIRTGKGGTSSRTAGILSTFNTSAINLHDCKSLGEVRNTRGNTLRTGGISAFTYVNTGEGTLVVCENCEVGCLMQLSPEVAPDGNTANAGALFGSLEGTAIGVLQVGSEEKPCLVKNCIYKNSSTSTEIPVTAANFETYAFGHSAASLAHWTANELDLQYVQVTPAE